MELASHLFQDVAEADVALHRIRGQALYRDVATGDRRRRPEIAGRRRVRFDGIVDATISGAGNRHA